MRQDIAVVPAVYMTMSVSGLWFEPATVSHAAVEQVGLGLAPIFLKLCSVVWLLTVVLQILKTQDRKHNENQ